jgi:hypothetical protein
MILNLKRPNIISNILIKFHLRLSTQRMNKIVFTIANKKMKMSLRCLMIILKIIITQKLGKTADGITEPDITPCRRMFLKVSNILLRLNKITIR